jgi:hypothetical protein
MSRARIRSTRRKRRTLKVEKANAPKPAKQLKHHRFIGISLGGGKTDKTSLSVIEYYPVQRKIFLSRLFDKIKTEAEVSADLHVPLQLPRCLICTLKCPGYEVCEEPEIQWMWKQYRAQAKKKSPPRLFTPYTERCVEQFLQTELEEPFHLQHALGANLAPLTARAQYLIRRMDAPVLEVFPKS